MRIKRYWLLVCVIMIAIFSLSNISHLSLYDGDSLSPEWRKWIRDHTIYFGKTGFFSYMITPHPDFILHKLGHIFGFGLLGTSLYLATGKSVKWGVFIAAIFAASDELHQYFIAGRSSRFGDIVLDVLAATCFVYVLRRVQRKKERRETSQ
jgi:glycopeptide antibiotics resistance protein